MIFSYIASFFRISYIKNVKQIIFGKIQKKVRRVTAKQIGR